MSKSEKIRFGLIQAVYWCSIAAFSAFAVALARSKGVSATYIGIMAAVFRLAAVFGQFFWGGICDRLRSNKKIFILTNMLMMVVSLGFYFANNPLLLLICYGLMGFVQAPSASNMDTWILKRLKLGKSNSYGPIRAMGSLGYAVFIFFFGMLVANSGYFVMPLFLVIFIVITCATSFTMPKDADEGNHSIKINIEQIKQLFSSKPYLFLLIVMFFEGFAVMSLGMMKILIWEDMNASIAFQGYDGFFAGMAQVPGLFIAAKLTKFTPKSRLLMGIILDLSMLVMDFFAPVPELVVAGSVLSGFGYGLILPAMREIITASTPEILRTTAQGLGDAAYGSLSGIIGSLVSGVLIDAFGAKMMILSCVLVELIPLVMVSASILVSKKRRAKTETV